MGRNTEGEKMVEAGARSVAYKPLPPPTTTDGVTQILFYQYVEPVWSARRQKQAIAEFHRLARENDCTGRGRIALEGVNCTLTAPAYGARRFCQGLRDWDPDLFNDTDFKLTDGVPAETKFKALTLKNTQELVAYGLGGERAPLLKQNTAKHLEADEYHEMLGDKDTVVIDVRNYYETCIGRIEPPKGGRRVPRSTDAELTRVPKVAQRTGDEREAQGEEGDDVLHRRDSMRKGNRVAVADGTCRG